MSDFFKKMRSGTRSLKTQLAIYFIPVTILPTIAISYYATHMFQEAAIESINRRALSERDAVVAEIDGYENELLDLGKKHATSSDLLSALRQRDTDLIFDVIQGFRPSLRIRIYRADGSFIVRRPGTSGDPQIPYISIDGIKKVKSQGFTIDRYFAQDGRGFITLVRYLVKDKFGTYGILEEENLFGDKELNEMKSRRGLDVAFLSRDFTTLASSIEAPKEELKKIATSAFQPSVGNKKEAQIEKVSGNRYGVYLYDFPAHFGRVKYWGYITLFLPMSGVDAMTGKLKLNLILTTAFLILCFALLNFLFSNRVVKPIEVLVYAMKRVKTGRVEQIPPIESAYEIEYMVHAFNEMTRNVSAAKKTLEEKLKELKKANQEIKNTQSTLVQSAKMISLGQIVAGVAHELNNPIGFIYSNMHHLEEYVEKLKVLVNDYRTLRAQLPPEAQAHAEKIEKELDIDFILKDMDELTRSCVDGAKRTKDIVTNLRSFSRMDETAFRPEDLQDGIRSTLKLLATELKNRITVHEVFNSIPKVECSSNQLNQVWMNLITNAAQAIEGKGEIWIRTRAQGDTVVVEIEDSGAGMPPSVQEKIFDPFFTTKRVGQGTGLGLSIVYGIVQKHQGKISVKSALGKGTLFTVELPIHQSIQKVS